MQWFFKRFDELSLDELYGILQLRAEVFVVEQDSAYQDLDEKDQMAYHMFVKKDDEIIAVLRILPENITFEDMTIGRVAVKKQYRGQGISRCMMKKAMNYIINDLKKDKIRLAGQAYLTEFYENLGFRKVSDKYIEEYREHYDFLYEVRK